MLSARVDTPEKMPPQCHASPDRVPGEQRLLPNHRSRVCREEILLPQLFQSEGEGAVIATFAERFIAECAYAGITPKRGWRKMSLAVSARSRRAQRHSGVRRRGIPSRQRSRSRPDAKCRPRAKRCRVERYNAIPAARIQENASRASARYHVVAIPLVAVPAPRVMFSRLRHQDAPRSPLLFIEPDPPRATQPPGMCMQPVCRRAATEPERFRSEIE